MPPPPPHPLFWTFKGDLTMTVYAKFDEFLTVRHFLNGLEVLDDRNMPLTFDEEPNPLRRCTIYASD